MKNTIIDDVSAYYIEDQTLYMQDEKYQFLAMDLETKEVRYKSDEMDTLTLSDKEQCAKEWRFRRVDFMWKDWSERKYEN